MSDRQLLSGVVPMLDDADFSREKNILFIRLMLASVVIVLILETLLMFILEDFLTISHYLAVAMDGLLLVGCLFPINYFLLLRPMSRQIEQHRQTNLELAKTNEILERFFSINDVLIAYLDARFNFIRVNQAYANADQKTPPDFIGKNHFDLYPDNENRQIFDRVVSSGKPVNVVEKPFYYAGNPERGVSYWDWSLIPVKGPAGQVVGLIMVLNDVTARKNAQAALVESERRFKAVFNQAFQHSGLLDPAGNILVINQTALDFTGIPETEVINKPLWQAPWWEFGPEGISELQAVILEAASGRAVRFEGRVRPLSGDPAFMDMTIKPLLDETGMAIQLIYEARDITKRILAEEALKRSDDEIKRLYHAEMRAHHLAETLRSAGQDLSKSLNSGRVLETLLDHLAKVVPYQSAHIYLFEDPDHLAVRLARNEESWDEADRLLGKQFEVDQLNFLEALLHDRQIISISDTSLSPGAEVLHNPRFVRSWLGIPLPAGDQTIGICTLEHPTCNFFTEDQQQWAAALVSQAAVAVQNAWLFEQVRDNRERLQALSRRLVEVQELERHHIARELHDEAGQALTSLMVGLRVLEREGGDRQAVATRCQELRSIADGVVENLHRLSVDLRPSSLDHLGLVPALRQHTEMISSQHTLAIQFAAVGQIERLPEEMETAIYRIVQEALTNVIRHAHASRVDILLERRGDSLVVIVEDNGVGFDPQHPKINQLGLLGMRERADMLGGSLIIESSPGQGSTIVLEVPCPSASS